MYIFFGRRPLPFDGSHLRLPSGPAGIRTTSGSLAALARPPPCQLSHRVACPGLIQLWRIYALSGYASGLGLRVCLNVVVLNSFSHVFEADKVVKPLCPLANLVDGCCLGSSLFVVSGLLFFALTKRKSGWMSSSLKVLQRIVECREDSCSASRTVMLLSHRVGRLQNHHIPSTN